MTPLAYQSPVISVNRGSDFSFCLSSSYIQTLNSGSLSKHPFCRSAELFRARHLWVGLWHRQISGWREVYGYTYPKGGFKYLLTVEAAVNMNNLKVSQLFYFFIGLNITLFDIFHTVRPTLLWRVIGWLSYWQNSRNSLRQFVSENNKGKEKPRRMLIDDNLRTS